MLKDRISARNILKPQKCTYEEFSRCLSVRENHSSTSFQIMNIITQTIFLLFKRVSCVCQLLVKTYNKPPPDFSDEITRDMNKKYILISAHRKKCNINIT